jgi:bifunctional DNA-binding transcriptional regulator/antitoxin component of YhaV-PrlF toxin-antitoxin module
VAYYDALVALDKIKDVKKGRKPKKVDNKVSINSRGSLVIPKKLVDALNLGRWIPSELLKSDSGLMLQTVKKSPKTILRKRNGHTLVRDNSEASMPNCLNIQLIPVATT